MDQCVRRFREFLVESPRRETRDIGDIPAKELNVLIGEFLFDLKRPDGSDYEPDSLIVWVSRGRSACTNASNSAVVSSSYLVTLNKSSMFVGAVFDGPVHFHFHKH